jgi:hypothetical protein
MAIKREEAMITFKSTGQQLHRDAQNLQTDHPMEKAAIAGLLALAGHQEVFDNDADLEVTVDCTADEVSFAVAVV